MIGFNRTGLLLIAAAVLAGCSVSESGNIPCGDTTNCPGAYPTCSSKGFCVEAAPPATLELVAGDAQSAASGSQLTQALTVRVLDKNGNAAPDVAITWAATGSATLSATSTKTGPDGKSQVTATLGKQNGAYSYTAAAAGLTGSPATFNATGFSGPAAKISGVSGNDQTTVVGTTLTVPLAAKVTDVNDNPVAGVTVSWATADGGTVAQPSSITGADGVASTTATVATAVKLNVYTASATDGSAPLAGSPVTFNETSIADVAKSIIVAGFVNPTNAGAQHFVLLTVKDQYGNTAIGYRGTVHLTATPIGANPPTLPPDYTFLAGDLGSKSLAVTLNTASSLSTPTFTITATDTANATITGFQAGIVVNPAAANHLVVTAPATSVAGVALTSVTVTAKDFLGNTVTGYTGTVHFTSTDPQATPSLPADYTFTAGDLGSKSFTGVVLKTVGPQTIAATDLATPSITGTSNTVNVTPAAAKTLLIAPDATSQTAGTAFGVTVTAKDAFGNLATGYTGTVHFTSTDAAATAGSGLPSNYTFTGAGGDAGVHLFSVTLKTAGTQTVTVTDVGNGTLTATTGSITVAPGQTSKLVIQGISSSVPFPATVVQGSANTITIIAQDANGNLTPLYTGTVQFATNNASAILPADHTFTALDAGIHTFTGGVTLAALAAGTALITVTDTANLIAGTQNGITVVSPPIVFQSAAARIVGGSRDGQIFITGGSTTNDNAGTATKRTYFYDPATGGMVPGPNLNTARYAHTATATVSGQVVIAGGDFSASNADGEFELCSTDGASPGCTAVNGASARRNAARCNAAAALVTTTPSVRVIIAGGDNCANTTAFTSWDLWDSASPTITTVSAAGQALATGRRLFTATAVGSGKVLFAGGSSTASADLFTNNATLSSATMGATGVMSAVRSGHTATLLLTGVSTTACPTASAACVLIAGGTATAGKTWEIYDSGTNSFPRGPAAAANDLLVPGRNQHAAAVFANGKVLLAGGNDGAGNALKSSESFDPTAATLGFSAGIDFGSGLTRNHPAFAYALGQDLLIVAGGNATAPTVVTGVLVSPAVDQLLAP